MTRDDYENISKTILIHTFEAVPTQPLTSEQNGAVMGAVVGLLKSLDMVGPENVAIAAKAGVENFEKHGYF